MEYWIIAECKVKQFDPSPKWQSAIRRLMKNKIKALERIDRAKATEELREKKQRMQHITSEEDQEKLKRDMDRLRLG